MAEETTTTECTKACAGTPECESKKECCGKGLDTCEKTGEPCTENSEPALEQSE